VIVSVFPRRDHLIALAVLAASCGGGPIAPPPPPDPIPQLLISCPSSVSIDTEIAPQVITYSQPVTTGGAAPVQTTCTINSGTPFSEGVSEVLCTATDSGQRRAQCTFSVTVNLIRRLKGTRFLAFGDSITKGEVSNPAPNVHDVDDFNNYPVVLESLLRERYVPQKDSIVVDRQGRQGERASPFLGSSQTDSEDRFAGLVRATHPDAVLLMEGVNDANDDGAHLDAQRVVQSLRSDVTRALKEGVKVVFVSTLLPEVPGRSKAVNPEGVEAINDEIRSRIPGAGGIVVDSYAAFRPMASALIGIDGLHPTIAGYHKLAETWLEAIKTHFEQPAATTPASLMTVLPSRPAGRR
jgi:lysophospholipase L1-like esterase